MAKIYRARGVNPYTKRDVWVTNVWSRDRDDAAFYLKHNASGNYPWSNLRVVEMDYDEFLKKKQRLPRF